MPVEVTAFRTAVGDWLGDISTLTALVGDNVFSIWPVTPPVYPFVTFSMRRSPATDYPAHAWAVELHIDIHGDGEDENDTIEDAVVDDMSDEDQDALNARLCSDDVLCVEIHLTDVDETPVFDLRTQSYVGLTRRVDLEAVIVRRS